MAHRHTPEVQALALAASGVDADFSFVPHSGPFARGIHVTVQAVARAPITSHELVHALRDYYDQSVFVRVGGQLLKALAHTGRRMALKDLAREAEMTPAKAHPYLVSFGKLGLIEQDPASGHYGLGPLAIQMGLISLQQGQQRGELEQ